MAINKLFPGNKILQKKKIVIAIFVSLSAIFSSVYAEDGGLVIPAAAKNLAKRILITKIDETSVKIEWSGFCNMGWNVKYGTDSAHLSTTVPLDCATADVYGQGKFSVVIAGLQPSVSYYYRIPSPGELNQLQYDVGGRFALTAVGIIHAINLKILISHMRLGDQSSDVRNLQEFLYEQGLFQGRWITGYYGPLTAKAIKTFQERYAQGILFPLDLSTGTGYTGVATISKINKLWGF